MWSTSLGGIRREDVAAAHHLEDGRLKVALSMVDILDHGGGQLESDGMGAALLRYAAQ